MNVALAAGEAFFALGVTFFATLLLLLFNPRSSGVRWYALFQLSILVWLFAQGAGFLTGDWETWRPWMSGAVHLSPGFFLAFAIMQTARRLPLALLAIGIGVALLPIDQRSMTTHYAEPLLLAWTIGGWVLATWLFARMMGSEKRGTPGEQRLGRTLLVGISLVMPVGIVGSLLMRGSVGIYFMPAAMVWIQALLFVGVARLRFYNIEVRAVRTGELAAAAAEQERLAVVGELSASLAHEIRNPLTGVRSLAQRLAEEEIPEDKRRRYASVILEEVGRVERLVANLLGIARRAPRVRDADARTPLAPLFDDLALLVAGRAEKAGVRVAADARGLTAASAREPLAQALLNLLLNAVAHTPAAGTISLLAREEDGGVTVAVRDTGPGVPREQRERIWEPFHSGGDGTGLGLAVVRRLAREEGWTVDVDDAPGGGAEFRIHLPAAADPARPAPSSAARTAGLLAFVVLGALPAHAQPADSARIAVARERAAALRDSARVPGVSVAVAAGGRIVWAEGFGWSRVEDGVPATAETIYQLGSVSKPLTAAGLMRLAERGAVDLDAPVQRYVPSFPDRGAPITLRQLAAHLGGIRHYEPRDFGRPAQANATVADRLAVFADDPLVAPPGTRHAYSSYGYVLLSAAMQSAARRDFPSLMRDEVFAPLGMESTGPLPAGDPRRAENYGAPRAGAWPPSPLDARSGMWAAASSWSSTPDLARFAAALLRPGFLRPESVEAMWTPQRTIAGEDTGYGLGWRIGRDGAGRRIVHHGGRTQDLRAFLLIYPDHDLAIAVVANGPADFAEEAVGCIAEPWLARR
jgi:CubicO group peptidase (beta-lactamase class C family)/signal transduction histidine kinase